MNSKFCAYFYAVVKEAVELPKAAEEDRKMLQDLQGHFEGSKTEETASKRTFACPCGT